MRFAKEAGDDRRKFAVFDSQFALARRVTVKYSNPYHIPKASTVSDTRDRLMKETL
jgi:hypothetical protein